MSRGDRSASESPIVARDRVIDAIRLELHTVVKVERRLTIEQICEASGVTRRALRTYMTDVAGEDREPPTSSMLSLAVVLGPRAVNKMLSLIGYGGAEPLDEPDTAEPMTIAGDMMTELAIITQAAARGKGRINHQDAPAVEKAANQIVADALKLSSIAEAE